MPFLTKIKELFKQLDAERCERGKFTNLHQIFSSYQFLCTFVFYSAGPRYSERKDIEVNQEGKLISQEREEKHGASFLHRLIKEQKMEMEA